MCFQTALLVHLFCNVLFWLFAVIEVIYLPTFRKIVCSSVQMTKNTFEKIHLKHEQCNHKQDLSDHILFTTLGAL